jgi:hypothetical protein
VSRVSRQECSLPHGDAMGADFCDQQVTDYYRLEIGRNFAIELLVRRPPYQ